MASRKEGKVILVALSIAFGLFVLGYHGGKQLAMAENASAASVEKESVEKEL